MDELELRQRIDKWENLHTEFKAWSEHNDELAASLVALANTDGGQLIVGVANDHTISGVPDADRAARHLDNLAAHNCQPPLTIVQEIVATGDGTVLVVNVPQGDERPYRTNRGVYYIRTSSGKRQASRQELLRLFQRAGSLSYDEITLARADLTDLDLPGFERIVQTAYPAAGAASPVNHEQLLLNLRLAQRSDGRLCPTVTAMLFFGRDPQQFLPQAYIAAARVPGSDISRAPSDSTRIDGTLLDMLEGATRFLRVHLRSPHRIVGLEPEAYPELPEAALREVMVNALAHRDYSAAAPTRLLIYDDRVEVRTPGGPPNTVTIESMKLGAAHVLRNPSIYLLLSRLGMVTDVGSGVSRVIGLVQQAVGREPEIRVEGEELVFALPRPKP